MYRNLIDPLDEGIKWSSKTFITIAKIYTFIRNNDRYNNDKYLENNKPIIMTASKFKDIAGITSRKMLHRIKKEIQDMKDMRLYQYLKHKNKYFKKNETKLGDILVMQTKQTGAKTSKVAITSGIFKHIHESHRKTGGVYVKLSDDVIEKLKYKYNKGGRLPMWQIRAMLVFNYEKDVLNKSKKVISGKKAVDLVFQGKPPRNAVGVLMKLLTFFVQVQDYKKITYDKGDKITLEY